MAAPKQSFQVLRNIAAFILIFLALVPMVIYILIVFFVTLPYSLYHFSANWGIRRKDMPVVQKYLDCFQSQNPSLASHLAQAFQKPEWKSRNCPDCVRFWPHKSETEYACIPFIASASVTDYTFSLAAGLFFMLEELGFQRRMLWEFLMNEVETNFSVSEEDKVDFRRVMEKLCTGYVIEMMLPKQWKDRDATKDPEKGFSLPNDVPMGSQIVPFREGDGMQWILNERALIVPMDWTAYRKASGLLNFGLWSAVKKDLDLEDGSLAGSWQCVDLRTV